MARLKSIKTFSRSLGSTSVGDLVAGRGAPIIIDVKIDNVAKTF